MSLGTLGRIGIEVGANLAGFESDMGRANRIALKESSKMKASLDGAVKAIAASTAVAAGLVAVAVKSAINRADELDELSQKVGAGVRELSQIQFGAQLEGVSDFSGALTKLGKAVVEAKDGNSQAAKAFGALGVATTAAGGQLRSTDQILLDVAQSFSEAKDGATKAAIAQELFGRSGADLIPFLNNGREGLKKYADLADRLGLTLDAKTAAAAGRFNDQLFVLKAATDGLGTRIAAELIGPLAGLTEVVVGFSTKADLSSVIAIGLKKPLQQVSEVINSTVFEFRSLQAVFDAGKKFFQTGDLNAANAQFATQLRGLRADYEAFANNLKDDFTIKPEAVTSVADGITAALKKAKEEADKALKDLSFGGPDVVGALNKAQDDASRRLRDLTADLQQQVATFGLGESALIDYRLSVGDLSKELEALSKAGRAAFGEELADMLRVRTSELEGLKAIEESRKRTQDQARQVVKELSPQASGLNFGRDLGSAQGIGQVDKIESSQLGEESKRFEQQKLDLINSRDEILKLGENYDELERQALQKHEDEKSRIQRESDKARTDLRSKTLKIGVQLFSNLSDAAEAIGLEKTKRGFELAKQINTAQAIISTAAAINNALAVPPFPLGVALAASAGVAGAAQVAAIQSQKFPGRKFGGPISPNSLYEINEGGAPELIRSGGKTLLATGAAGGVVTPARVARDTGGGVGGAPNVKIEIINQAGVKVTPDVSTGPDGAVLARFVLSTMLQDLADNGPYARGARSRIGARALPNR